MLHVVRVTDSPARLGQVCDFLNTFTRNLSGYYGPAGVRILVSTKAVEGVPLPPPGPAAVAAMHARVHLCTAFRQARHARTCVRLAARGWADCALRCR